jgi:GxxExxY protein
MAELLAEPITRSILGAFFEVYNRLGFGFLEQLYATALERELRERGHHVLREVHVRVSYKGRELGVQRLDMVVDDAVVVETKATLELHRDAWRQLYNYLRATKLEVGLLLHFGRKPRFRRIVCSNAAAPRDPITSARSASNAVGEPSGGARLSR